MTKSEIKVLVVDDELLARERICSLLHQHADIKIVGECVDGREAINAMHNLTPDLVFLDIQMPEMDGFQVIEEVGVERMPVTVFVTAYDKHALRAFEAHALDYLLKPFDYDRFDSALQRAKTFVRQQKLGEISESLFALLKEIKPESNELLSETDKAAHQETIDRVVIKSGGRIYFLRVEEIDWVEGASNYLTLHSASGTHLIRETMGNFHAKLDAKKFLRIHRSTIVNIERIKDIQPLFKGEYFITLTDGKRLRSSRGYRHELQPLLNQAR
jgi:two-component system LytT family response regulator